MVAGDPQSAISSALQTATADLGDPPTVQEYEQWRHAARPSATYILAQADSWAAALDAAGLDPSGDP